MKVIPQSRNSLASRTILVDKCATEDARSANCPSTVSLSARVACSRRSSQPVKTIRGGMRERGLLTSHGFHRSGNGCQIIEWILLRCDAVDEWKRPHQLCGYMGWSRGNRKIRHTLLQTRQCAGPL